MPGRGGIRLLRRSFEAVWRRSRNHCAISTNGLKGKGNEVCKQDLTFDFHGVRLNVDVHNSYKAKLLGGKHDINIAAERTVKLKESGIECSISQYRIDIRMSTVKKRGEGRIMPISLLN